MTALYAHRLGRAYGPDNSLEALAGSLRAGVEGVETDVCLTADGELALLHDPWLPIGTTADGWADRTPWADTIEHANLRDRHGETTSERILRLEDVLDLTPPEMLVQLDVKVHGDHELASETVRTIAQHLLDRPDADRVEVLSFHSAACGTAARLGLRSRMIVWADHDPAGIVQWARDNGIGGVCVEHFLLDDRYVEQLRSGGLSVTTGTVNDPELARRVATLGVDAITTDDPARLGVSSLAASR
jgi:glycerophosphoryl diester phosphodiesterase